jgi:hypothetical protein
MNRLVPITLAGLLCVPALGLAANTQPHALTPAAARRKIQAHLGAIQGG